MQDRSPFVPDPVPAATPRGPEPGTRLDLRGLKCPLPALKTRRALAGAAPGEIIEVLCTDPLAGLDIPHLVLEMGDILLLSERHRAGSRFLIRRSAPSPAAEPGGEDPSAGAGVDRRR